VCACVCVFEAGRQGGGEGLVRVWPVPFLCLRGREQNYEFRCWQEVIGAEFGWGGTVVSSWTF